MALVLLLGELESTDSERPLVSEGEASTEESAEGTGRSSSKLLTGRIEAIRRGWPFELWLGVKLDDVGGGLVA